MSHSREIHISGAPGSGKSYLGDQLRQADFYVVDMDEFFQPGDGRWERLVALRNPLQSDSLSRLWHTMKAERFEHYRRKAPTDSIIWVGLTDHAAAPDEPFYSMDVGQRFYIRISNSALCHQYHARLVGNGLETDWLTVSSSADIIADALHIQETHVEHGYTLLEHEEIRKIVLRVRV